MGPVTGGDGQTVAMVVVSVVVSVTALPGGGSNGNWMVSGELGGAEGRDAGRAGAGSGARVAWDGGAVAWGAPLRPCNQSGILKV
jgi:hypothetical protein